MRQAIANAICSITLICASISFASGFPTIDADIKTYDDHITTLNAVFDQVPSNPADKSWVKLKLSHMVEVDQYMRNFILNTPPAHQYSDLEKQEFQMQMGRRWYTVDTANTTDLKILLKDYIWFKISDFGAQADKEAWLLVQHADGDPNFQKQILIILNGLWQSGETNPSNYAYLYDRVAASWSDPSQRKPQRYGTQGICTGPGIWQPLPIEDPEHLDERRNQVGLGPEADYIIRCKDICH